MGDTIMRAAIYARVSTADQTCENQLAELRRYVTARGWTATEHVDAGVSGAKDSRPALDAMLADVKRRRVDVVVVWRLDRLGRSLRHLVTVLDEMAALGVAFVSLGESLDTTTPAGKLHLHMIAAFSEFERGRIQERVRAGLARVKAQGRRLGRPLKRPTADQLRAVEGLSVRNAARVLGVSWATANRIVTAQSARV